MSYHAMKGRSTSKVFCEGMVVYIAFLYFLYPSSL